MGGESAANNNGDGAAGDEPAGGITKRRVTFSNQVKACPPPGMRRLSVFHAFFIYHSYTIPLVAADFAELICESLKPIPKFSDDDNYPQAEMAPLKAEVVFEGKTKRMKRSKEGKK